MFKFSVAIPSYEPSTDAIRLCLFVYECAKKKKKKMGKNIWMLAVGHPELCWCLSWRCWCMYKG